jgi:hypothetical protein
MAPRTHAAIALGPTGNLQGSVKFYCITTGRILKRRSFTPMPMPDHVIQRVNAIGTREKQGRTFRFLNRRGEPFEWTDEVQEDDPEFQGLLEETADTAVYPDISAELPGVLLEEQEQDFQPLTDDPEPDFRDLAGDALYNAGIDTDEAFRRAQLGDTPPGPAMVEANEDELVYELTFDLPDAGLGPTQGNQTMILGEDRNDNTPITIAQDTDSPSDGRRSPTRAHRSAAGNQPYDAPLNLPAREPVAHRTRARAPHTTFLQLGMARAHRSVLEANKLARMTKEEQLLATTTMTSGPFVDDATHRVD